MSDLVGERVFVRAMGDDFGRTGEVKETYDGPHETTYVVDLDGAGDAHVARGRFLTADEFEVPDR